MSGYFWLRLVPQIIEGPADIIIQNSPDSRSMETDKETLTIKAIPTEAGLDVQIQSVVIDTQLQGAKVEVKRYD